MKIEAKEIWRKIKIFILIFVLFCVLYIFFDCIFLLVARIKMNSISTIHAFVYSVLSRNPSVSVSMELPGLPFRRINDKEYYLKDIGVSYYPEAFGKPNWILLKSKYGRFYYLTFGDGTRALVTYYSYRGNDANQTCYIRTTGAERFNYTGFWIIPLCGVAIGVRSCSTNMLLVNWLNFSLNKSKFQFFHRSRGAGIYRQKLQSHGILYIQLSRQ